MQDIESLYQEYAKQVEARRKADLGTCTYCEKSVT